MLREVESIVRPLFEKNGNAFVLDCPADIGTHERRCAAGAAVAVQPALQRGEVHRAAAR